MRPSASLNASLKKAVSKYHAALPGSQGGECLELWKSHPTLIGVAVSDLGRIKEGNKIRVGSSKNPGRYRQLSVHGRNRYIHALVCETFRGPRPLGQCVRHLDGDSLNNCLENLVWGTRRENEADKIRHGRSLRGRKLK